ncbi:TonB-dependent receptor [Novosphingobium sp.]|uniref:TonB-dependent receptor domain-containing protein n=1 Tax=Novosphingobium sp. TaxID=1874826 RepID=UPI0025D7CB28|nr:TonB-dependent receptor [Novosphingobium sp.]
MNNNAKIRMSVLLATSALGLWATPALALKVADDQPAEQIVVTGSALPTSPDQVAVPVSVVSADAIQKSGVNSNVLEILRKAIPAFAGRSNTGNSNANNNNQRTAGGSSIQLRNLDTLILVNGRRIAPSAISGVNGKVFVNVSEIPPDAIERIEVLTDGASAIYGSDAIGGVVNIILKSNYQGGQVNARYGGANGYNERSAGLTYGFNPLKNTNITISASYSKSDPLYQSQRSFSSPFYSTGTAVPGSIGSFALLPGVSSPTLGGGYAAPANDPQYFNAGATTTTAPGTGIGGTYDLSRFNTLLLQQEQKAVSVSLNSDLSGDRSLELFGDFEFARNDNFTRFIPTTLGVKVPVGSPVNPFTAATSVTFGSTANPTTYTTREDSFRGTLGLRGQLPILGRGGNWEVAYTHSENTIDQTIANLIYKSNLLPAVSGGFNAACVATAGGTFSQVTALGGGTVCQPALDPFSLSSAVSPASLANVLTNELIHGRSKIDTFDGKIVGSALQLPGGKIQFAVGASWRREAVSGTVDPTNYTHVDGTTATAAQSLIQGALNVDPFKASRTITAQFAEVRLPLLGDDKHITGFYGFDLIGAVRHEHYSGVGDSTVPKVGFRWAPVARQITIRGNYARSFTAPSLYALVGPINFRTSTGPIGTSGVSAFNYTFNAEDGNNPALTPAHSDSFSLGIVLKPDFAPHLRVDAEFNSVKVKGLPGGIGFNNILADVNASGSASPFFGNISTGNFAGLAGASNALFASPGGLATYLNTVNAQGLPVNATSANTFGNLYIVDRFTNLGETRIKSLNFTTNYDIPLGEMGTISLMNQSAVLLSYKNRALPVTSGGTNPAQLVYEFAGTTTQGGGSQGTLPRLRMYTSLDWNWKHWDLGVANTYIAPVSDIGAGGASFYTQFNAGNPAYIVGRVKAYSSWDLRASWTSAEEPGSKGLTITAGVNNLFNRMPPVSTNINPAAGANAGATAWRAENNTDVGTYGAIGRLIYVSAAVKF